MHYLAIPLGLFAVWKTSRNAPTGTVLVVGLLFSLVGGAMTLFGVKFLDDFMFDTMIIGLICLPIGAVEVAQHWLAVRRQRREELKDFSIEKLQRQIFDLAQRAKSGEKIEFEVVRGRGGKRRE